MKLGIFTDSHYSSQAVTCGNRYNSQSLEKIKSAMADFAAAGCELVICLGDLIDREQAHEREVQNLSAVAEVLRAAPMPVYCVMGNHDGFAFTVEEFYKILGDGCRPRTVTREGKTLLFLDACYFSDGVHYAPGDTNWEDTFLPDVPALEQALARAEGEVLLFLHQNLDPAAPENHALSNRAQVLQVLKDSGKVRTVFQGHYHPGVQTRWQDIDFVTFPALCEGDGVWFVVDR